MFSGSPNAESIIKTSKDALHYSTEYLKKLDCKGTTEEILKCALNKKDRKSFIENKNKIIKSLGFVDEPARPFFSPVVDGHVLTDHPKNLLSAGNFKKCPVITGVRGNFFLYKLVMLIC